MAADAGLELTLRRSADSASAAREAVRSMLEHDGRIDGLLVFNDLMAAGALKALHDAGRRVPEDCAVIGMDGIPLGELVTPELTGSLLPGVTRSSLLRRGHAAAAGGDDRGAPPQRTERAAPRLTAASRITPATVPAVMKTETPNACGKVVRFQASTKPSMPCLDAP